MSENKKPRVVVIGGGFAGIQFVRHLDKSVFDVLLIDKVNHHQFQPLFYQVATSQIEPASISFPLRNIFRGNMSIQIRMTEVSSIDTAAQKVHTGIGAFDYDYLVVAVGCQTNFFGNDNIAKNVFTLKSSYDAITIRNHILMTFERTITAQPEDKAFYQTLVIVGAGPTGVELAGAFAEIRKQVLPKDYPRIDFSKFTIYLVEGSADTLSNMSPTARAASRKYLEKMGVQLLTKTFVKDYDGERLHLSNGTTIKAKTVIWAAGVTGNRIEGLPAEVEGPGNRIRVDRFNKVDGLDNVFAVGDIAYMETPRYPRGHPQVANVAINQAKLLASNFSQKRLGKALKEYTYKDLGSMATIGRNKAVVDLPILKFKGYAAWLVWMFLHLMLILSVRNRLVIFINWAWLYVTKNTSLRLILVPESKIKT
ncbi:NAD(P)/FAD-dependent oxidoreductase [Geofilum rubicundum]|uniref:NADH:ubiquinone reductase (non-electrogenic) n=1 Tax=Geofilum rubicundum JCM 15548 TaxID=1236989 RepID=A0A0E9LR66_9BACT|nr:NAD(P)/FAD-dependent oxidoreductase [Geofilum rubicundum]GAO28067.1 NADH dehydrogenase [Geofilum rubicundum JCM 15548]